MEICLQCGDRGFSNAFVYCVYCLGYVVHRYCLNVMPANFDEFVHWVCDDCKVKLRKRSTLLKCDGVPRNRREDAVSRDVIVLSGDEEEKLDTLINGMDEHVCEGGSLQPSAEACTELGQDERAESESEFPAQEFKGNNGENANLSVEVENKKKSHCSASEQLYDAQTKDDALQHAKLSDNDFPLKKNRKRKLSAWTNPITEKDQQSFPTKLNKNDPSRQRGQKYCSHQSSESDSEPGKEEQTSLVHRNLKKMKTDASPEANSKEHGGRSCSIQSLKEVKVLDTENHCIGMNTEMVEINPRNDYKKVEMEAGEGIRNNSYKNAQQNDSNVLSMLDYNERGLPVISPIWRGIFNIWNKSYGMVDGLVAHMSSYACKPALDEASRLQPVLHLEMLPKLDVWPKSFNLLPPSDESIAIYFFPSDPRHERVFDHLVDDMWCQEFAMRASVSNAELLIFTSQELPLVYWRFNGKHYLWGVFRSKQASSTVDKRTDSISGDKPVSDSDPSKEGSIIGGKNAVKTKNQNAQNPLSLSTLSNSASNSGEIAHKHGREVIPVGVEG